MSVPQTPNLGLYIPTPDDYDSVPSWGQLWNQNAQTLDGAIPSESNPLTPEAFNVNADIDFHGWSMLDLGTAGFSEQDSDPATLDAIYFKGGEFYVSDNAGNHVQITSGGSVNAGSGNIIGLPSTPAGAGIVWVNVLSAFDLVGPGGTVFAGLRTGPVVLFDDAVGPPANGVTLRSPDSLAASYDVTFPAATPASTGVVLMASTGDLSVYRNAPNTSAPTYGTNWSGTLLAWKDALGYIHMSGTVVKGAGSSAAMFTLPVTFRPADFTVFAVGGLNNGGVGIVAAVSVTRDGSGAHFSLEGTVTTGFQYYFDSVTYYGT